MNIEVCYSPAKDDIAVIYDGLLEFNRPGFPGYEEQQLACFLKDGDGRIVGGVLADIFYENIYVQYLWLSEHWRGQGHGSALLQTLEQEVSKAGVEFVFLDTFSFQAPEFYRKYGFEEVARLDNYPRSGVSKIFFRKQIGRAQ